MLSIASSVSDSFHFTPALLNINAQSMAKHAPTKNVPTSEHGTVELCKSRSVFFGGPSKLNGQKPTDFLVFGCVEKGLDLE